MNKENEQRPMTLPEMQQATEEIMRELGVNLNAALKEYFPGSGFALLVFPATNPRAINYISNVKKEMLATALDEIAKKIACLPDVPAPHKSVH